MSVLSPRGAENLPGFTSVFLTLGQTNLLFIMLSFANYLLFPDSDVPSAAAPP